jgi:hypothetical protein
LGPRRHADYEASAGRIAVSADAARAGPTTVNNTNINNIGFFRFGRMTAPGKRGGPRVERAPRVFLLADNGPLACRRQITGDGSRADRRSCRDEQVAHARNQLAAANGGVFRLG